MLKIFGGKGKRKKRKKYDEYDEYEDDEYEDDEYEYDEYEYDEYEDDEYEDDEYEDDEEDEYEEVHEYPSKRKNRNTNQKKMKNPTLGRKRVAHNVGTKNEVNRKIQLLEKEAQENNQKIAQLENNLENAQLTNQSLENELSMVQALPRDYETKISELTQLKTKYNELLMDKKQPNDGADLTFYRKKVERLTAKVHQYEQELWAKQEEIDRLLAFNTDTNFKDTVPDIMVYEELEKVRQELAQATHQLELKEIDNEQHLTKEDIGEVLLGAKQQAKEIVNTANKKAQFITSETQKKTEVLKRLELAEQEYRNYCKRIKDVKEESEQAFNQIMSLVRGDI